MATPQPKPTDPRFKDITDKPYGRLTVLFYVGKPKGNALWHCRCKCGNEVTVQYSNLTSGNTQSCGCLLTDVMVERNTTHGNSDSPEYETWQHMKRRCLDESCKDYKNYGARGITVCDRWLNSFQAFFEDMGKRPSPKHSIERVDNSKGYEPGNCVWATKEEQMRNTRRTVFLTSEGKTLHLAEWCRLRGLKREMVAARLDRGWSHEDALRPAMRSWSTRRGARVANPIKPPHQQANQLEATEGVLPLFPH